MAQFSVHKNKNPKTRDLYPYLVDVQADLLRDLSTRVVVPLTTLSAVGAKPVRNLMPIVEVEGQQFAMQMPLLAGIGVGELGPAVAAISQHRNEVVAALDFLITGI